MGLLLWSESHRAHVLKMVLAWGPVNKGEIIVSHVVIGALGFIPIWKSDNYMDKFSRVASLHKRVFSGIKEQTKKHIKNMKIKHDANHPNSV